VLAVFQAMDGAGKDSTITHVFTGVSPTSVDVHAFKSPTPEELDHDYLWRTTRKLPARGRIGVFNRSYYEEVLVCKVHPEIVTNKQRLPEKASRDLKKLFQHRYRAIAEFEKHLHCNGTHVVKFFLHVSKREQAKRFLGRLDDPSKNWKFDEADLIEREFWDDYMDAYETMVNKTGTDEAPWYIIPADDKKTMRLLVAEALLTEMRLLHLEWPQLPKAHRDVLERSRQKLEEEVG
jgi:PPK2 family polyphosphate:nucleotide phosphotransferase